MSEDISMCDGGQRRPNAETKRILRKEANYGCALCGVPLIEYHHIVPYSEKEHNDPDHMIALCDYHHRHADAGAIKKSRLYELKENPHIKDKLSHDFSISPTIPTIQFGGLTGYLTDHEESILLRIEQENVVVAHFDNDIVEISAKLRDEDGTLIAEVNRNSWWAETRDVWDLVFKPKMLKIWNAPRDIGLQIRYDKDRDMIIGRGKFYYHGDHYEGNVVKAYEDKTELPDGNMVRGLSGSHQCILKIDNGNDPMRSVAGFGPW